MVGVEEQVSLCCPLGTQEGSSIPALVGMKELSCEPRGCVEIGMGSEFALAFWRTKANASDRCI